MVNQMVKKTLLDTAHGYSYDANIIELDQLWGLDDGVDEGYAMITVRYDPEGATHSSATAIVLDELGKQVDITFRDFPSRWWRGVHADMVGTTDAEPSQSMIDVAEGLADRVINAFNTP